ncbi:nucleoside/nucleotide kinase family protein [Actinopolymorpha sp. B9G3]|uniref:nucleoside/nucleotide kinase family protein n=1 Tax=Actinopolymorpha sp. B9G3 TaxID=3158970 RepID=UPI0032D8D68C
MDLTPSPPFEPDDGNEIATDATDGNDATDVNDLSAAPLRFEQLVDRAEALACDAAGRRTRTLLGIVGAPGAGKSTLATGLVTALVERGGEHAAHYVPMDGFHLANAELDRLDRRDRKGAPDTFDAAGYVALLRRLRDEREELVYAPRFHREIEEPIAGAIGVHHDVGLVVTEGNYLLMTAEPWSSVRTLLDEVWFLDPPADVRHERLIARHQAYGKSPDDARAWALGSDERNAELIAATRTRADLVLAGTVDVDRSAQETSAVSTASR